VNILVLITSTVKLWNIPAEHVDRLRRAFPAHTFVHALSDDEGMQAAPTTDAAFAGHIPPELLAAAPRLRWIHSPAAGIGGMLYPEMVRRAVVLTNSRAMSADSIAEHVVMVTLALFRQLPMAVARQAEGVWAQDELSSVRLIAGSHVLIVGLGSIGEALAVRMSAMGARVTGIRRRPSEQRPPGVSAVAGPDSLHRLLRAADIVVISAPQTRQTTGMIGAAELCLMKRDAILVNVSRGKLVDERALVDALRERKIGGAALDVFEQEPLDGASPLWRLPNVLITPHTAGFLPDHWGAATDLFAENLRRFDAGLPLLNTVDKDAEY
jgi:phosphoglycerate dehydrogenase-like enzyme